MQNLLHQHARPQQTDDPVQRASGLPSTIGVIIDRIDQATHTVPTFQDRDGTTILPAWDDFGKFQSWLDNGGKSFVDAKGVSNMLVMGFDRDTLIAQIRTRGSFEIHFCPPPGHLTGPPERRFHFPSAQVVAQPSVQPVATPEQQASFLKAVADHDLERAAALLKDIPSLVTSKGEKGWTALHTAACNGHMDLVDLLLANNADVNAKDDIFVSDMPAVFPSTPGDSTPLHFAAFWGHLDVAKLLLANRADANAKNSDGRTPLGSAESMGRHGVADLLRQHGGHP